MGNIFSSEEKLLRPRGNEVITGRDSRKGVKLYEQYKYHQSNNLFVKQHEHKYKKKRNTSFHGRYSRNDYIKPKSHSLSAILEDLYAFEPDHNFQEKQTKFDFESRSLIPRIKLRRSTSSLKDERRYNALYRMSSDSEIFIDENSSTNIKLKKEISDIRNNFSENNITVLLNDKKHDEIYDEFSNKSNDNYFTKNFDDCMKRLQLIEKEHELIEKVDTDKQLSTVQKEKDEIQLKNRELNQTSETNEIQNYKTVCEYKSINNSSVENIIFDSEIKSAENPNNSSPPECIQKTESKRSDELEEKSNDSKFPNSWYSNIKNQFEKNEQENQEQKTREMSCRITGATLKNQNEKSKSEEGEKNTRHYFSRLVKTNKTLIDEELPDPDKVKNIRAMFQEHLNSSLKRKLDKKLGGSLQNISSSRAPEQQLSRPLSAQCYTDDVYSETRGRKCCEENDKRTSIKEISRPLRDINGEYHIDHTKRKLLEKYEKDLKPGKEQKPKKVLQPKWTDTGSVSSGISSDLSSYDTDIESYSREGTEQDEMIISDDDLLEEVRDKHYVQNEVLEKIRSFGTSVTYYGGEMITCSVGPLLSPTTQAIIEEIGEKCGDKTNRARSFDEFYRKYVEINEPNRKKKLGRTRSFGQTDVFQKPNVLSNSEIEMYKNDLEIEIGIKKPVGFPQGSLRKSVTKSTRLKNETKEVEKPTEKYSESAVTVSEPVFLSDGEKQISEGVCSSKDDDPIIENKKTDKNEKPTFETKLTDHNECHATPTKDNGVKETVREERQMPVPEKERPYLKSESAPEGLPISKNIINECEILTTSVENPTKEIYFSYEKSVFSGKRKPDMEFEEFEVCETLTEKLEKLEKINSFEKVTEFQENLPIANPKPELQEVSKISTTEKENKVDVASTEVAVKNPPKIENEIQKMLTQDQQTTSLKNINPNEKKDSKFNLSRWPIETSVMVDIQKNNEKTPKIITGTKTVAKTKIRLF